MKKNIIIYFMVLCVNSVHAQKIQDQSLAFGLDARISLVPGCNMACESCDNGLVYEVGFRGMISKDNKSMPKNSSPLDTTAYKKLLAANFHIGYVKILNRSTGFIVGTGMEYGGYGNNYQQLDKLFPTVWSAFFTNGLKAQGTIIFEKDKPNIMISGLYYAPIFDPVHIGIGASYETKYKAISVMISFSIPRS